MLWHQEGAAPFLTGPRFLSLELGGCVEWMGLRMWEEINSGKSVRPAWGLLWAVGLRHGGCAGVGDLGGSRKERCDQVMGALYAVLRHLDIMVESMRCHSRVSGEFYFR